MLIINSSHGTSHIYHLDKVSSTNTIPISKVYEEHNPLYRVQNLEASYKFKY